jgi:hypothetical protein
MNLTSTYGVEQPNGFIFYNVYPQTVFENDILYEFRKGRSVEFYKVEGSVEISSSIDDYFSLGRFNTDKSIVRGVLRRNGVLEYRYKDEKCSFMFTLIK